MIKTIALFGGGAVLLAIAAVLAVAASKPDTFRVHRSTEIAAPPEKVFALINDYRAWITWSPYETKDPDMRRSFSGAATGRGAVYAWEGNGNVGTGSMEITDTAPPNRVTIKLDFVRPFEAHNTVDFTLEPDGRSTKVSWDMQGPIPFIAKVVHVFLDMDSMVGKDFEMGLANLKKLAEAS